MRATLTALALVATTAPTLAAQRDRLDCDDSRYRSRSERFCEIREQTIEPRSLLDVDGSPNGGIAVYAWDRNEILIRTMVTGHARSEESAREIARDVEISYDGSIYADGPRTRRNEGWSASFEVFAPANTDLRLRSNNGGLHIEGIRSNIRFETTNGGASLVDLGGRVTGRTTNGGTMITLTGSTWDGEGLDVETTNGGVDLYVPDGYSAHLVTGTVNGGIDLDFPITVSGRIGRRLEADIGGGGPTIRATTVNGGVELRRR